MYAPNGATAEAQPMLGGLQQSSAMAKINQLGQRAASMSMTMDLMFFSAGVCVLVGAIIATVSVALTEFAPFELVDCVYLLLFGLGMVIMDAPLKMRGLLEAQAFMGKYFKFLTRFTGRGVWYIFLGTMTFATLWDNSVWSFGAVVLGFFVFGVGVVSTSLGVVKSLKLNRVRNLIKNQNANSEQVFISFARTNPHSGMTDEEFNVLCGQVAGVTFRPDEMAFVMNSICDDGRTGITLREFHDWVASNYPTLL